MNNQIRNGIHEARLLKKMSDSELASILEVDVAIIKGWESGAILPSLEIIRKLVKILSVSTDMLLLSEKREPLIIDNLNKSEKTSIRRLYNDIKDV